MKSDFTAPPHTVSDQAPTRARLESAVLDALPPLVVGVIIILAVFLAAMLFSPSASSLGGIVITAYAALLAMFLLLILGLREKRISARTAPYIATGAALLTMGTVLLSLRSGEDATSTYLIVIVMIAMGYIALSRNVLLVLLALVYTAWAVTALPIVTTLDFDRLSFSLAIGAILAVAIFMGRVNQLRHQEEVLRLENQQQASLRAELEERRKVEQRLRRQLDMEQLLSAVVADLGELPAAEIDRGVRDALERIGRFAGVDRAFLLLLDEGRTTFERVYDWQADGIGPPGSSLVGQDLDDFSWTIDQFSRHRLLNVGQASELPEEAGRLRSILRIFDIQSLLAVPVAYGSIFSGVIGFDMERGAKQWQEEEITLIQFAGDIVVRCLERKRYESTLERMATFDTLTDLPNRSLFNDRLNQAMAQSSRSGEIFALLLFDIDDFKIVNDSHGHLAGDEVLRQVARRISAFIRSSDTLARLGGDEFAIVQRNAHDADHVQVLIDRLLGSFSAPFQAGLEMMPISISLGATLVGDDLDGRELIHRADLALYEVKNSGGNGSRIRERSAADRSAAVRPEERRADQDAD